MGLIGRTGTPGTAGKTGPPGPRGAPGKKGKTTVVKTTTFVAQAKPTRVVEHRTVIVKKIVVKHDKPRTLGSVTR